MARTLGTLTVDLLLKAGAFESDAGRAARIADKEAKAMARSFDAAGKAIGLALAAGVTTVAASVGVAINRMDELSKAAQRANMPTEQFSALAHAADLADVSMQDLQGAMGKLARAQGEALVATSQQAKTFEALGISVKNADGSLRNTADVFLDFSDKFQQFKGSPEIMAAGMDVFGRSFQNLIPLLKDGSAGLRSAMDEAKALGLVLSTAAGANAEQFNDNLSRLKTLAGGLGMSLASELLPRLVAFTDNIVEMVKAAGGAEGILRKLSGAFDTLLTVAKAAGVYIGTMYAVSLGLAAVNALKMVTSMTALSAAIGKTIMGMTALRTAAALLFGPAGLIAAGATAFVMLATRETQAEKAARAHKDAIDAVSGASKIGAQYAYEVAKAKRDEAVASLQAAKGLLAQANAQAALSAAQARGSGSSKGGFELQGAANFNAARADDARKNVQQMTANVLQLEAAMKNVVAISETTRGKGQWANVQNGSDLANGWLPDPERLDLTVAGAEKVAKSTKSAADAMREAAEAQKEWQRAGEDHTRQMIADEAQAMDRWADMTAQLQGPMAQALHEHEQRMKDIAAAGKAAGASAAEIKAAQSAEIERYRLLDPMVQDAIRAADDYRNAWVGAASDAARAFGDWFANGFKGAKDFARNLKDIFKRLVSDLVGMFLQRSLVDPFRQMLQQISGIGVSAGGFMPAQSGGIGDILGNLGGTIVNGIKSVFGFGGSASQGIQSAVQAGTGTAMDGWFSQMKSAGGLFGAGVSQSGGILLPNGQVAGSAGAGFGGISPWMGGLTGAAMGWGLGGDTPGKIGGALAGGALGYGAFGAAGALSAGGGMAGAMTALGPAGWIGLAALAINAIAGGKLFGTKYKPESGSQQFGISDNGAFGSQSVTEVRQKSFFRGRQWKTTTTGLDAEAMAAVNELFATISKTIGDAAGALGVEVPAIVGGTFKREFDSKGNLTREFGNIAGRVYNEAQEAFAERLLGENLLAVAKQAGSAAELEQLASAYRGTGKELQEFATLALAVQSDLMSANGLWKQAESDGVMTRIVEYIEGMARAGESLAEAYARVAQTMQQYGDLIGGVRQQIAVSGLNAYQKAQLDQVMAYREQVKQANELAKALGMSGARAEDLAAIEQLHAINMAALTQQYTVQADASRALADAMKNQQWLQDLDLSELSPLRDDQKLAKSMELLRSSVAAGDYDRSQELAKQALNFGRDLYASGADYNALYTQVTGLVGSIVAPQETMEQLQGLTNEQLSTLADLMTDLPSRIAQELAALLVAPPPPATVDPALPPAPVPAPPPPPPGGGGGGGYTDDYPRCVAGTMLLDDGSLAVDASAGDVHGTHDPAEGFRRHAIRVRGEAVLQPCVRIVTESGAALVCSRSTPFTDPDAPADLPEYSTLAPDMAGQRVFVQLLGATFVDTVTAVEDAGTLPVIPLDFGGRSFAAGECADALVYSHNIMKATDDGYGDISALVGVMSQVARNTDRLVAQQDSMRLDLMNLTAR